MIRASDRILPAILLGVSAVLLMGYRAEAGWALQDDEEELEALLEEERSEADRLRRRGRMGEALDILKEHLREEPEDAGSRIVRAACRVDRGEWSGAESDLIRALGDAADGSRPGRQPRWHLQRHQS